MSSQHFGLMLHIGLLALCAATLITAEAQGQGQVAGGGAVKVPPSPPSSAGAKGKLPTFCLKPLDPAVRKCCTALKAAGPQKPQGGGKAGTAPKMPPACQQCGPKCAIQSARGGSQRPAGTVPAAAPPAKKV